MAYPASLSNFTGNETLKNANHAGVHNALEQKIGITNSPDVTSHEYRIIALEQHVFNVKTYGAIGDNSTDDTIAIQNAINAAHNQGGGVVVFPGAIYRITTPLTLYSSISLQGVGMESTIIHQTAASMDGLQGSGLSSVGLYDLTLQGNGSGSTPGSSGSGVNLTYGSAGNNPFHNFRNVRVTNWGADGIRIQTPIVSNFQKVYSSYNGGHGFNWYEGGTSCNFQDCWARQNSEAGYRFYTSVYQSLTGCAADNNGTNYMVVNAQSIGFFGCGSEGALVNGGLYNGYGWYIDNSSVIKLDACWITDNRNLGVWVTNGANGISINAADNTPNGTAVNFITVDSGCNASIHELHNTTANNLATGTTNIYNDGAGKTKTKTFMVSDTSGDLQITAATDGGDFNIFHSSGSKILAIYGAGAASLTLELLDGDLIMDTQTASRAAYFDASKKLKTSAVTDTELGYVSGVTSALQTQLNGKVPTSTTVGGHALSSNVSLAASDLTNGVSGSGAVVLATSATLTTPHISSIVNTGTLTLPTTSDTLVGRATTDTLTNKTLTSPVINTPTGIVKGDVGLGNVDNTSDATKNSAVATLTNKTLTSPVVNSPTGIVKGDVGLGNVDNTSDATKNSASVTLTNKTIDNTNTETLKDTLFTLQNASDITKQLRFQLSGLTTATIRTLTIPDTSDTLVTLAATQALTHKDLTGTGNTFPTFNQSTTGSAATLTTPRSIYGNNFDGSAALAQIIASTFGGTGNGFAKLSGPTTSEKTFTLPNASANVLTDNALVTVAQGGSGAGTLTGILKGNGTSAFTAVTAPAGAIVGDTDTQTLSGKTLTAPKLASTGFIADANGNALLTAVSIVTSAVDGVTITNAATANPALVGFSPSGSDSNVHMQVIGKGNGLTKVSFLRQDDTTNSYKHNSVVLTGWGIYAQGAAANKSETVTFGITFAQRPIVLATYGGDNANVATTYGSGGNNSKGPVCCKAHTIATGSFIAQIHTADGTSWGATDNTFYQWAAFGEL